MLRLILISEYDRSIPLNVSNFIEANSYLTDREKSPGDDSHMRTRKAPSGWMCRWELASLRRRIFSASTRDSEPWNQLEWIVRSGRVQARWLTDEDSFPRTFSEYSLLCLSIRLCTNSYHPPYSAPIEDKDITDRRLSRSYLALKKRQEWRRRLTFSAAPFGKLSSSLAVALKS